MIFSLMTDRLAGGGRKLLIASAVGASIGTGACRYQQYTAAVGTTDSAPIEPILMICPLRCASMIGNTARCPKARP